jgi:hypothetical protein
MRGAWRGRHGSHAAILRRRAPASRGYSGQGRIPTGECARADRGSSWCGSGGSTCAGCRQGGAVKNIVCDPAHRACASCSRIDSSRHWLRIIAAPVDEPARVGAARAPARRAVGFGFGEPNDANPFPDIGSGEENPCGRSKRPAPSSRYITVDRNAGTRRHKRHSSILRDAPNEQIATGSSASLSHRSSLT